MCIEDPRVPDPSPLPIQVPQPWELSEDLGLVSRFAACGALPRSVNVLEVERFEARELRQAGQVETGQADGIALQLETFQLLRKGRGGGIRVRRGIRVTIKTKDGGTTAHTHTHTHTHTLGVSPH